MQPAERQRVKLGWSADRVEDQLGESKLILFTFVIYKLDHIDALYLHTIYLTSPHHLPAALNNVCFALSSSTPSGTAGLDSLSSSVL